MHIPFPILVEIEGISTASSLQNPAALERIHVPEVAPEPGFPPSIGRADVLPVVSRLHLLAECPRDPSIIGERFAVYSYTAEASVGVAISAIPGGHTFFLEGA